MYVVKDPSKPPPKCWCCTRSIDDDQLILWRNTGGVALRMHIVCAMKMIRGLAAGVYEALEDDRFEENAR